MRGRGGPRLKAQKVTIAGSPEAVKQAKEIIKSLTKYHWHEATHPGLKYAEVEVEAGYYSFVIGPGGSEIKHIKGNYKCEVYIPDQVRRPKRPGWRICRVAIPIAAH